MNINPRQFREELTKYFISCRHLLALSCSRRTQARTDRGGSVGTWGNARTTPEHGNPQATKPKVMVKHAAVCQSCELLPIPTVIPRYREMAAAQKEGMRLNFSNGGQLSPMGCPLARATQGDLVGG